jgi:hypothetical protein
LYSRSYQDNDPSKADPLPAETIPSAS